MKYFFFLITLPLFSMYNNSPAAPELPEYGLFIEKDATWGGKSGLHW